MRLQWLCLGGAILGEFAITLLCEWLLARGHAQAGQLRWLLHLEGLLTPLLLLGFLAKASNPQRAAVLGTLSTMFLLLAIPVNHAVPEPHIQIDKSRNELVVQDASKAKLLTIFVGLGPNAGSKQMRDDGRTPEGSYRICAKEAPNGEQWLGLNYPNRNDALRGRLSGLTSWLETGLILAQNQLGLEPCQRTALGNGIGIHQGPRYTAGSIGAAPETLAKLYELVEVGCLVDIH